MRIPDTSRVCTLRLIYVFKFLINFEVFFLFCWFFVNLILIICFPDVQGNVVLHGTLLHSGECPE